MNRKRLEGIRADLAMARHFANSDIAVHAVERAEAALAAEGSGLRECDVGTMNEQAERYRHFCSAFARCRDCPFGSAANGIDGNVPCALAWMLTVHTPEFPEIRGPAGLARTPREPPASQQDAAAAAADIQGILNAARIDGFSTSSILTSRMVAGMDLGYSDAGCRDAASAVPPAADRFELPF